MTKYVVNLSQEVRRIRVASIRVEADDESHAGEVAKFSATDFDWGEAEVDNGAIVVDEVIVCKAA